MSFRVSDDDLRVLDVTKDCAFLTEDLLNFFSVSGAETELADAVYRTLTSLSGLSVHRDGDTILASTHTGASERIILAGHLDTVPLPTTPGARGTVPAHWATEDGRDVLYGRGATDMKAGVAVQLKLAHDISEVLAEKQAGPLARDVTWVFYDHEEVEASKSGLGRLIRNSPELLQGDFAVLLEPTHGAVEGGCNGTCRFLVTIKGVAAHSGRSWMGENAIHRAGKVISALDAYMPQTIEVEGLEYREGLNIVKIHGGVAGNVIPDSCVLEINYRFAPDKTEEQAHAHVFDVLSQVGVAPEQIQITDTSAAARPGLHHPAAQAFMAAIGGEAKPKYGWTDVARFSAMGIPAVNFAPGDALLAHSDDEHVHADEIRECYAAMRRWLLGEMSSPAGVPPRNASSEG